MKAPDHIFMKILPEMYIWDKEVSITIWKSSVERRPAKQQHFLFLILEMWFSMTVDFLNVAAKEKMSLQVYK